MQTRRTRALPGGPWASAAVAVALGLVYLAIGIAHDRVALGVAELAIMVGFAAVVGLGRRRGSETATLLSGEAGDERYAALQLRALATTGAVLVGAVVLGLFWSLATGSDTAGVFTALAVLSGVTTIAANAYHARRG